MGENDSNWNKIRSLSLVWMSWEVQVLIFTVWGFQLENNVLVTSLHTSTYDQSLVPNDVAYITGENFTDFYNQSEGTLVLSADIAYLATSNGNVNMQSSI